MSYRVLLVDDEEVFSSLTQAQLTNRGFSVNVVTSGEEALEKAKAEPPDAILLDIMLPGMNGMEVLKRLRADPRTQAIPVIVCSITMREKTAIQSLLQLGANAFVPKPCKPDELAARLKELQVKGGS